MSDGTCDQCECEAAHGITTALAGPVVPEVNRNIAVSCSSGANGSTAGTTGGDQGLDLDRDDTADLIVDDTHHDQPLQDGAVSGVVEAVEQAGLHDHRPHLGGPEDVLEGAAHEGGVHRDGDHPRRR